MSAEANSNFHTLTASTVFDGRLDEARFREYRRCWKENPRDFRVADFPLNLDIESTGACNLRCPFCASTSRNWGPHGSGYMDLGLFRRIIDEGAEHGLPAVKLSLRGEPLLHKQIHEMVAYAKSRGVLDVYFNTNAVLLTEARFRQLIEAGLDRISISMEGTTKAEYEVYRVGADYDAVAATIRSLKGIRDKLGVRHPRIRLQTVMLPRLRDSFPEYVAMWAPHVDEVAYVDARREGPEDDHRGRTGDWSCPFLWQRMVVLWDGTLLPCLMHGVRDFSLMSLGNVRNLKIKDVWGSERVQGWRRLHEQGRAHEIEACDRCSYRAMELEKRGTT